MRRLEALLSRPRLPAASFALAASLSACGGGGAKAPTTSGAPDAGAEAGAPALATSPPPSGLPPMASMPPPGVVGSKVAKVRPDPDLARCSTIPSARAKDPAATMKAIAERCASVSKMKAIGDVVRGAQSDRDAHQESRFLAEPNRCYRVYFAGDAAVEDLVVVLRDAAGDIIATSPAPAVPEDGAACFTAGGEVTLLVSVGHGKGTWAAQVFGD